MQGGGAALPGANAAAPAVAARPFHRLLPVEVAERRRQGLCFNCDEPYVRGHVCPQLFFLEADDYIDDDLLLADAAGAPPEDAATLEDPVAANALVVSLHAVADIRADNTTLVPVTIKGQRFLALLDKGSTHTYLQGAAMRCLGLTATSGEQLRVTVANGDRLPCEGISRHVPMMVGTDTFSITCVGLDLGCFDFIIGVDFLRTLGPILWDFEAMTMTFSHGDRRITWGGSGDPMSPVPNTAWPRPPPWLHTPCWTSSCPSTARCSTSHGDCRQPGHMIIGSVCIGKGRRKKTT